MNRERMSEMEYVEVCLEAVKNRDISKKGGVVEKAFGDVVTMLGKLADYESLGTCEEVEVKLGELAEYEGNVG
jgi:hypothetical protein